MPVTVTKKPSRKITSKKTPATPVEPTPAPAPTKAKTKAPPKEKPSKGGESPVPIPPANLVLAMSAEHIDTLPLHELGWQRWAREDKRVRKATHAIQRKAAWWFKVHGLDPGQHKLGYFETPNEDGKLVQSFVIVACGGAGPAFNGQVFPELPNGMAKVVPSNSTVTSYENWSVAKTQIKAKLKAEAATPEQV